MLGACAGQVHYWDESSVSGMWGRGLHRDGSGEGQVAGTCDCGNEVPDSVKCSEFLDKQITREILKKDSAYGVNYRANYSRHYAHFRKSNISFVMAVRQSIRTHRITRPPLDGKNWQLRLLPKKKKSIETSCLLNSNLGNGSRTGPVEISMAASRNIDIMRQLNRRLKFLSRPPAPPPLPPSPLHRLGRGS
jgi:hypothetical protein